ITGLPRSYGPVRPCASHRYSAPHGSATWSSPLASRRQVPTFRTRASRWPHAVFMPVTTRTVGRHPPSFFPGQQLEPGFGDVPTLSTRHQRFTCVRLASAHLTGSPRLFRNAHHLGHWTKAACGGLDPDPAIRARGTCPHLLCSKAASSWLSLLHGSLLFAPSWRTIISIPTPRKVRVRPRHPEIERVMQEQVRQDRAGDGAYRRWKVASRAHSVPKLVEIVLQVGFELLDRLPIHTGRTRIGFDRFVSFIHSLLVDTERLACRTHRHPPVSSCSEHTTA